MKLVIFCYLDLYHDPDPGNPRIRIRFTVYSLDDARFVQVKTKLEGVMYKQS